MQADGSTDLDTESIRWKGVVIVAVGEPLKPYELLHIIDDEWQFREILDVRMVCFLSLLNLLGTGAVRPNASDDGLCYIAALQDDLCRKSRVMQGAQQDREHVIGLVGETTRLCVEIIDVK
jgi:hypothetical protein